MKPMEFRVQGCQGEVVDTERRYFRKNLTMCFGQIEPMSNIQMQIVPDNPSVFAFLS